MAYLINPNLPQVLEVADEVGGYAYVARVNSVSFDGICEVEVTVVGEGDPDNGFPIRGRKFIYMNADDAEANAIDRDEALSRARALMPYDAAED